MYDQLNFIEGGDARGDAVMADFTRQLLEVVPSIRHSGGFAEAGSDQAVRVRTLHMDGTAIDEEAAPSPLIYKLWEEPPAAPATFCAHVAVINSNTTAYLLRSIYTPSRPFNLPLVLGLFVTLYVDRSRYSHFEFMIEGRRPPAGDALKARRIFTPGAFL